MTGPEVVAWATYMAERLQESADKATDRDAKLVLMSKAGSFRVVAKRASKPARPTDPKPSDAVLDRI